MRGNLLAILVHAADIQDRDALVALLDQFAHRFPRLVVILADTAYRADWRTELERDMKLMGCTSISQLSRENLRFR